MGEFIFAVMAVIVGVGLGLGLASNLAKEGHMPEDARNRVICDYLDAKQQGKVCIKKGLVVYPEPIGGWKR